MTLLTAHRILIGTATAFFAFYAGWEFTGGGGAGAFGGAERGAIAAAAALGLGFYFRTLKPAATSAGREPRGTTMVRLYDADSEAEIGQITEAQLDVMTEQLVEESLDEYSYNITSQAIASLESGGADPALVSILKRALGSRTSVEVRYEVD